MKRLLILLLLFCFNRYSAVAEKIEIYETFKDYQNNTPQVMDGEVSGFPGVSPALQYNSVVRVKEGGKKKDFACSDFWGFKYKDVLFRNFKFNLKYTKNGLTSYGFMALVSEGKICYWENGIAILEILNSNKEIKKGEIRDLACDGKFGLSKTKESDINTGRFNGFFNSNKEFSTMPAEFKDAALKHDDCPKGLKKDGGLKTADKLFDLGGTDDIAFFNAAGGVNNYAGKPMGLSAGIFLQDLKIKYIRDFFKDYNGGNFNSVIYNSEFK